MVVTASRDIEAAAAAAQRVVQTHARIANFLRVGQTLPEIDSFIARTLKELDCRSAFLNYSMQGHPPFRSHSCLSLNSCIVHGEHLTTNEPLKPGDILSIDIGVFHQGWVGDAAWTYAIQSASEDALRLMRVGREALARGIASMQPGRPLVDWARTVQEYVEKENKLHLIRGLGGHGYGKKLHGPPFISNVLPKYRTEWPDAWIIFKPGMLLAVEPMIALGTHLVQTDGKAWPIYTADGSIAVHYEADVLITDDGPRDLTEGMQDLPDIVG
ncbi:MAG: type I methionyl aminopeptidase [Phycisphaerales bacterium]|nr:type I methionyl aminopeptidase [Phycisphaerales bacterium]